MKHLNLISNSRFIVFDVTQIDVEINSFCSFLNFCFTNYVIIYYAVYIHFSFDSITLNLISDFICKKKKKELFTQ